MTEAVLLLMHQGKSFTEEAAAAVARHGLSLVALSSCPAKPDVLDQSTPHLADWLVTERPRLGPEDLAGVVAAFAGRGHAVRAALATFEGYRLLMAELNRELGARDSSPAALRLCLNKYELRRFLGRRGLSAVRCHRLRPAERPRLDPAITWFVKPVRGAASFAAFVLRDLAALDDLPQLQQQMKSDARMAAIFMDEYDFLVEEYVDGPEFSFETVVLGDAHHIAVHEKARVERLDRTTLEVMSISPPLAVSGDVLLAGADFVSRCLRECGLTAGAFHVEAKYWTARERWEIVEINPRMGGSLINASVEALTGSS
ncbi:MAG TPA: ATP-grasp domain-containing protein, partial [Methylomirabilota bacterium]|nr:ATP-grasp domain-containing protein [Methylomirabilota bacterium]